MPSPQIDCPNRPGRSLRRPSWIATFALVVLGTGGTCEQGAPPPPRAPIQFVVAVDMSTSLTPAERGNQQRLLKELAASLDFGDRLVLLKAHAAGVRSDTSTVHVVAMPAVKGEPLRSQAEELEMGRGRAERAAKRMFQTEQAKGTDLLSTLYTAGERARETTGARTVLVLLSDMLHCADSICMEPPGEVPDSTWVAARTEAGRMPGLDGICIVTVGADVSTDHGVRVREFWRRYFRATGADFSESRYVHGASSAAMLRCGLPGGGSPATVTRGASG
ncbi:MAG TPA: hypothetical protein VF142_03085 [Longimicrobium sp.]